MTALLNVNLLDPHWPAKLDAELFVEFVLLRAILGGVPLVRWNEDGTECESLPPSLVAEWIRVASYTRHLQESIGWGRDWS